MPLSLVLQSKEVVLPLLFLLKISNDVHFLSSFLVRTNCFRKFAC